ncbi:MAG: hypothetical protein WAM09_18015 [Anaerolineales bacterium]
MPSRPIRTVEVNRKIRTYIAIGAVTLIVLLVTLVTAGKEQIFRCDRLATGEVDCVVRQSILGVIALNSKTTSGVQAVSMGQQCVDVDCNYRLEMYATQGLVPVNEKYTPNFDQLTAIREQINNFFKDTSSSYVQMKEETNPVLMVAVVVVFLVIWVYLGYLIWQVQHPSPEEKADQN